jgi:hypothetical protein
MVLSKKKDSSIRMRIKSGRVRSVWDVSGAARVEVYGTVHAPAFWMIKVKALNTCFVLKVWKELEGRILTSWRTTEGTTFT